jgi:hypothetical protein
MNDEQWAKAELVERSLRVASGLINVKEVGNNAGTMVGKFLAAVGLGTGYSWCAAFLYYCLITAGANPAKLPQKRKAASVNEWRKWAVATGRIRSIPVRGQAFFWVNKGKGHIGRCLENKSPFETIEGNTNAKGSREGDGVYRKSRTTQQLKANELWGFINLDGLE